MSSVAALPVADFCKTGSGGTPDRSISSYYGGSIPWVKSGELRGATIVDTEEKITEDGLRESSAKLVPKGAILLAMYGATVGRVALLGVDAATNQAVCTIEPNPEIADARYVYHALQEKLTYFLSRAAGGAQPNISQAIVRDTKLALPPLDEQRRIAAILDKADALRRKRKRTLDLLDCLTQSIFLEMFGDPIGNPRRWPRPTLASLCERITVGIVVRPASYYADTGVPALRSLNIRENDLDLSDLVFVSPKDNDSVLSKTKVHEDDVVVVRTGQPGKAAVIPKRLHGANTIDILIVTPGTGLAPQYLCDLLNSSAGKAMVLEQKRGQIQQHLNAGSLKAAELPLPPIALQQRYVAASVRLRALKTSAQRALDDCNKLFSSVQSRAFAGQL